MDEQYPTDPIDHTGSTLTLPPSPDRGRSRRRRLAGTTAAVLILAGGGVGACYLINGSQGAGAGAQATSRAAVPNTPTFGNSGLGQGPRTTNVDSTTDTSTRASGSQLTGLVRIQTTLGYESGEAAGTGMVLTSDGEVVTNHHVVAGATEIEATVMSTGKTYKATVVGTDATDDVAVIQLQDASGLATVKTDTTPLQVGDKVTAVGDANGTEGYLSSATGQVLAVDQDITTQSEGAAASEQLTGLVEISNDVISGDSGGATYDADGEVAGMTTAASSGSRDIVGYAIPIGQVLSIAGDLEAGTVNADYAYGTPAFLGIGLGDASTTVAGVYRGTPAASAGISAGDTITSVDGARVETATALMNALKVHSPGDSVRIGWLDAYGASHSATVTLTDGPIA